MRILLISQEMPPETGWGGVGTYVDVLSEALAGRGADVHVLSIVADQPSSTARRGQVTVHRRPLPAPPFDRRLPPEASRRVWLALFNARIVSRLGIDPDVIECPEWMAEGLGLGLRRRWPLVVRLHSSASQLFGYSGQGQAWRGADGRLSSWLEHVSARRAHVVVSTQSNLDEVAGTMRLNPGVLHAIPYPVRLGVPEPMPVTDTPRVTFVGRLEPRKGPDVLLAAAPAVLRAVPEARFVFVGRDVSAPGERPSSSWLKAEAGRLGIGPAIELTGGLSADGVTDELRRASVCAFPSKWESFGNVVAEAATVGRPVVASSIPPFRELVDDGVTGRLAPIDDPGAWATAIVELLRGPERAARMGTAGAARIAGISAPDRIAGLALEAYEHAIARWRVPRTAP